MEPMYAVQKYRNTDWQDWFAPFFTSKDAWQMLTKLSASQPEISWRVRVIPPARKPPAAVHGQADAYLIATAPDLLAAIKHALVYVGDNQTDDSLEANETRSVLRAAIAKAELID